MTGGKITTIGDGANGVFATGSGTAATLDDTVVGVSGHYPHGIMASGGGTITATNVAATMRGANGTAVYGCGSLASKRAKSSGLCSLS